MLGLSAFVPQDPFYLLTVTLLVVGILVATVFAYTLRPKSKGQAPSTFEAYLKFIYTCFLKPHTGDGSGSQQDALVNFQLLANVHKLNNHRKASTKLRQTSTMLPVCDFFAAARTCLGLLRHS